MTDESAVSRVEKLLLDIDRVYRSRGIRMRGVVEPYEKQILEIVRKQDETLVSLKRVVKIHGIDVTENGVEILSKEILRDLEAKVR